MKKIFPPYINAADGVTIIFLTLVTIVEIIFSGRIHRWPILVLQNIVLIAMIYSVAHSTHVRKEKSPTVIRIIRDWYLVPAILFIYTQSSSIAFSLHGRDFDTALIAIDRAMFGVDPTVWIYRFAHPAVTEILQIAYASYYLFFIALFFEFYRSPDLTRFRSGSMMIVYGFYLSYIGYMLVPAVGPRFTLHDFTAINTELPGLFLTPYLRDIINSGGGAIAGAADPIRFVHRDAFPSGHTQLTLTAIYLAFSMHSKNKWWLLAVGSLLIVSTVYMRYHYVVDVLAGILFFFFAIASGKRIDAWWKKHISR